jgi:hypothetical protein
MKHRIALAAALVALSGAALAGNPHFIKGTGVLAADGSYVGSWKEAGLGNSPVTYVLAALSADFTYQCYTKSNNTPQGAPNSTKVGDYTQTGTFTPRNGQITGSLSLSPHPTEDCQGGGLKLCLVAVAYSGVSITDVTTQPNPSVSLPDLQSTAFFDNRNRPTSCT